MKPIIMLTMESCPYCKKALLWMEELRSENDQYQKLSVEMLDENLQPQRASQYNYYYVPTFFVDNVKIHEGVPTKEIIRSVFDKALEP